MAKDKSKKKKPDNQSMSTMDMLQMIFALTAAFGGFFLFQGPSANTAQAVFRWGLVAIGSIGLITVTIIRFTSNKDD